MAERIGIAVALLAMGYFGYCTLRCYLLWRAAKNAITDPILTPLRPGTPAIVYFTTPMCAPCKFAQQPALALLKEQLGEQVQIVQIDATQDPEAAERWQVQTVPTTFILDAHGKPRQVNHGVADVHKLRQQLAAV